MTREARYDTIADWYPGWVGDGGGLIAEGAGELLPPSIRGERVLDVACGHGRAARARSRASVRRSWPSTSRRSSSRQLARREAADALGITYRVADIAETAQWWDGSSFDGAVCEMAMMDIDDVVGTVDAVAAVVRPGGWFVVSMVHPCFPGNEAGLSSWPPGRSYFDEVRWTSADHNPDGVRIRVGSSHRTLSTYVNTMIDAGFALERMVEPPAPEPTLLLLRLRRRHEQSRLRPT